MQNTEIGLLPGVTQPTCFPLRRQMTA